MGASAGPQKSRIVLRIRCTLVNAPAGAGQFQYTYRAFAMELVRGLQNIPKAARGCVLTVGNYDGVHLGHQQMISAVKRRAAELSCAATVLVFEPSSKEFIDPEGAPPRLTRWREKFAALEALGVDRLVTLRFDEHIRAMSPQAFVDELIVAGLGARHVVVGDDFRYGSNACGTIESLRAAGRVQGFGVEQMPPFVVDGVRVSSTAVRERLERADFAGAARLLGRRYRMSGRVAHGSRPRPHAGVSHGQFAAHAPQVARCGACRQCGCMAFTLSRWAGFRVSARGPR